MKEIKPYCGLYNSEAVFYLEAELIFLTIFFLLIFFYV